VRDARLRRYRLRPPQPPAVGLRSSLCRGVAQMMSLDALRISGRSLPVIVAAEVAECGLACMAMVSRYHGHNIDLNGLRQRFALSLAGVSLKSLIGIADQLGFTTRPLKAELSALA